MIRLGKFKSAFFGWFHLIYFVIFCKFFACDCDLSYSLALNSDNNVQFVLFPRVFWNAFWRVISFFLIRVLLNHMCIRILFSSRHKTLTVFFGKFYGWNQINRYSYNKQCLLSCVQYIMLLNKLHPQFKILLLMKSVNLRLCLCMWVCCRLLNERLINWLFLDNELWNKTVNSIFTSVDFRYASLFLVLLF